MLSPRTCNPPPRVSTLRRGATIVFAVLVLATTADADVLDEVVLTEVVSTTHPPPGLADSEFFHLSAQAGDVIVFGAGQLGSAGGIYRLENGLVSTLVTTGQALPEGGGAFAGDFESPESAIDGVATVFRASNTSNGQGLYRHEPGHGITTIVDRATPVPGAGATFQQFGAFATDGGSVVFRASHSDGSWALYRWDGTLNVVVDASTPVPHGSGSFTRVLGVDFDSGVIGFLGEDVAGQRGVYRFDGTLTRVADHTTPVPGESSAFDHLERVAVIDGEVHFGGFGGYTAGVWRGASLDVVIDDSYSIPAGIGPFDFGNAPPFFATAAGDYFFTDKGYLYARRGAAIVRLLSYEQVPWPHGAPPIRFPMRASDAPSRPCFDNLQRSIYCVEPVFAPDPPGGQFMLIDFTLPDIAEGAAVIGVPSAPALTIDGAVLARPGGADTAFAGDDAGSGATLAPVMSSSPRITLRFAEPVQRVSFEIAHFFFSDGFPITVRVYDSETGGSPLVVVRADQELSGVPYGSGERTPVQLRGFAGEARIRRIEIGHELDGALPGFAIDNLAFETNGQAPGATLRTVPFPPAGIALAAGVLAMLGWRLGGAARAGRHAR